MNAIYRTWHVYAAPDTSNAATTLKLLIPFAIATHVMKLVFPTFSLFAATPMEIVLLCALLWVVRQRDEARADLADLARQL